MKLILNMNAFLKGITIVTIGFLLLILNMCIAEAQNAVTVHNPLEFGNFSAWGAGNLYISADANNTVTHDGNVMDLPNATPRISPQSGLIYVQFSRYDTYGHFTVTYSTNNILTSNGNSISFVPSPASGYYYTDVSNSNKNVFLYIGGKLVFTQAMPAGHYSGTLTVYVTYTH